MASNPPDFLVPIEEAAPDKRKETPSFLVPLQDPLNEGGLQAAGDVVTGVASGIGGMVASGLSAPFLTLFEGLRSIGTPEFNLGNVVRQMRAIQDTLTVAPKSEGGQAALQGIGNTFETLARNIEAATAEAVAPGDFPGQTFSEVKEKGAGEVTLERTGSPLAATAADVALDTALSFQRPAQASARAAQAATARSASKVDKTAREVVIDLAKKDEIPIQELGEQVALLGDDARIVDVGGANLRQGAKVSSSITRQGRDFTAAEIGERAAGVRTRMVEFINERLMRGRTVLEEKRRIFEQSRRDADRLYNQAFTDKGAPRKVTLTTEIEDILTNPLITKNLLDEAKTMIEADRKIPPAERVFDLNNARSLDAIKRAIDDKARAASPGSNQERLYSNLARDLREAVAPQAPGYREALNVWVDRKSAEEAFQTAKSALRGIDDPETGLNFTREQFQSLSDIDKQMFRLAFGEAMVGRIRNVKDTAKGEAPPSVFQHFEGSPAARDLLETVFESGDDLARFNEMLVRERAFADTAKVTGSTDLQTLAAQAKNEPKRLRQRIGALGTDVLFALNQNRFATLRLIQDFAGGDRKLKPEIMNRVNEILVGPNWRDEIIEMSRIAGEIPPNLRPAIALRGQQLANWLRSKKNLRNISEFAARAAVIEEMNRSK